MQHPETTLTTDFSRDFDPVHPLPEYPRPQFVRNQWINLNGLWDYAKTKLNAQQPATYHQKIVVPFCPESSLSQIHEPIYPIDRIWYRRSFVIPEEWRGKRILLHIGACDWSTEVLINDVHAASHTGGYLPFTIDITNLAVTGTNNIVITASDPTDSFWQQKGKQSLKPGGIYYTAVSGIWQTVWLEAVPSSYLRSFRIDPDLPLSAVHFSFDADPDEKILIKVFDADHHLLSNNTGSVKDRLTVSLENPHVWTPEDPYLYTVEFSLSSGDKVQSYFAMRSFGLIMDHDAHTHLSLNGKPYFQLGVLDQGYWPEGIYTAPSDEALRADIITMKELGFNVLRKHAKIEPARWYYWCDKLGMIVWQDMPAGGNTRIDMAATIRGNLGIYSSDTTEQSLSAAGRDVPASRENYKEECRAMIHALYNVPSIAVWVLFNEHWGQFNAAQITKMVRQLDPSRLIDSVSGWADQRCGDFLSLHIYFRPLSLPKAKDARALVISEAGGFGYRVNWHSWLSRRHFAYSYSRNEADLWKRYYNFMIKEVLPLKSRGLAALIYTQLSDVEEECNGLVTYDRKVLKMNAKELRSLNWMIRVQNA